MPALVRVSLNLVEYYFETKAQLLHAALERLEQQSHRPRTGRAARGRGTRPPGTAADRRAGAGQRDGALDRQRDAAAEAAHLLSLSHGLGTCVLIGRRGADAATEVLCAHLGQLFAQAPHAGLR
ncbi:hypothetical protein ACOBQB_05720 [Streptomyces sp. G5(2025)]|uniref:hypothetical protein n=1 Tax=Streptomyces sp. G5(2025) TaxID=3406628 RepID=UPI003C1C807C